MKGTLNEKHDIKCMFVSENGVWLINHYWENGKVIRIRHTVFCDNYNQNRLFSMANLVIPNYHQTTSNDKFPPWRQSILLLSRKSHQKQQQKEKT